MLHKIDDAFNPQLPRKSFLWFCEDHSSINKCFSHLNYLFTSMNNYFNNQKWEKKERDLKLLSNKKLDSSLSQISEVSVHCKRAHRLFIN